MSNRAASPNRRQSGRLTPTRSTRVSSASFGAFSEAFSPSSSAPHIYPSSDATRTSNVAGGGNVVGSGRFSLLDLEHGEQLMYEFEVILQTLSQVFATPREDEAGPLASVATGARTGVSIARPTTSSGHPSSSASTAPSLSSSPSLQSSSHLVRATDGLSSERKPAMKDRISSFLKPSTPSTLAPPNDGHHMPRPKSPISIPIGLTTKTDEDSGTVSSLGAVKRKGCLKVCSRCLVFEPTDFNVPLVKIPFGEINFVQRYGTGRQESLVVDAVNVVELKAHNVVGPFVWKLGGMFSFFFVDEVVAEVLPKLQELLSIFPLSYNKKEAKLNNVISRLCQLHSFEADWFVPGEAVQWVEMVDVIQPLVNIKGRLIVSDRYLYFQPFHRMSFMPDIRELLSGVLRIFRRRHKLRHTGLEFQFSTGTTLYIAMRTPEARERLWKFLFTLKPVVRHIQEETAHLETMRSKWILGALSTFDYLLFLNQAADRTFHDLTQYPVFPWVVADYTSKSLDLSRASTFRDLSKPVGALNASRLQKFKERKEMLDHDEPPFLYGTHYSTPGYVVEFLVRQVPEYMLRMQNGKYDKPDRLFHSIEETWRSCTENPGDVRELIPEFYQAPGSFLLNTLSLELGRTQDGTLVDDVILPPWAKNATDFTEKLREALECDFVSQNIHNWIDLIFGYKQRGDVAEASDNLFYWLTYEGAVDLDSVNDVVVRNSYEDQINDFGQTPVCLFSSPHPRRAHRTIPVNAMSDPDFILASEIRELSFQLAHVNNDRKLLTDAYVTGESEKKKLANQVVSLDEKVRSLTSELLLLLNAINSERKEVSDRIFEKSGLKHHFGTDGRLKANAITTTNVITPTNAITTTKKSSEGSSKLNVLSNPRYDHGSANGNGNGNPQLPNVAFGIGNEDTYDDDSELEGISHELERNDQYVGMSANNQDLYSQTLASFPNPSHLKKHPEYFHSFDHTVEEEGDNDVTAVATPSMTRSTSIMDRARAFFGQTKH